jgi:hypothetical protein
MSECRLKPDPQQAAGMRIDPPVSVPVKFSAMSPGARRAPLRLREHTQENLAKLG